jgi:hypothetical protein
VGIGWTADKREQPARFPASQAGAREGSREMAQHEIFVADAAHFIGKSGAKRLINQAWKQGFIPLRGVRPGESEAVEIPFNEGGRVDCKKSRIVIGRLCTTYLSVSLKLADLEWLAQAHDKLERQARGVASSTPQAAANARNLSPAEIGRTGGKKSGEVRRAGRKWVPHATELAEAACSRDPAASHGRIAGLIADNWKSREVDCPGHDTLSTFVSELRASGQLPQRAK